MKHEYEWDWFLNGRHSFIYPWITCRVTNNWAALKSGVDWIKFHTHHKPFANTYDTGFEICLLGFGFAVTYYGVEN